MIKKNYFVFLFLLASLVATSCTTTPSDTSSDESSSASESIDPTSEYTVTFDLNYAGAENTPASQTILVNNLVSEPTPPTRTDYTFLHWSSDIYGANAWDFDNNLVVSDMTLYAAWEYSYVEPPIPKKTFYLNAPAFWLVDNYTAGVYVWSDEDGPKLNWPGEKMTAIEGELFSIEIPTNYTKMLFVRLTPAGLEPAVGSKSQTVDLDLATLTNPDFNYFTVNEALRYDDNKCSGLWSVYPNDPEPLPPEETTTFYVDVPTFWHTDGRVAGIYLATTGWGAAKESWPGELMTFVSDEIYSFEVPESYVNVIFVALLPSGAEPATQKTQTVDLIKPTNGDNLYTIEETVVYSPSKSSGVWSVYTPAQFLLLLLIKGSN